jgi:hypothetical protein
MCPSNQKHLKGPISSLFPPECPALSHWLLVSGSSMFGTRFKHSIKLGVPVSSLDECYMLVRDIEY